ncbi:MAG: 7-cyano-7-deazaguanine synthase QueC [Candidatus Margulisbacteria bacterium]|nr:7-cyano-7-deazaguanine synthase QueC [Candidatus Margulisiibacteriota bacterium]
MSKKAIVLLSGGLDSTTTLYYAKSKRYKCYALIFDYGQRHKKEIVQGVKVAKLAKVPYQIIKIKLPWKGSSLLDTHCALPVTRSLKEIGHGIPSTYVPARNTIFLSFALSYAEAIGAKAIFIGANAVDFSGYPDCRPDYYRAFQQVMKKGVKASSRACRQAGIQVKTPLIKMTKAQIIRLGLKLKAPLDITWSCYKGGRQPCGVCDSCQLREKGFSSVNPAKPSSANAKRPPSPRGRR